MRPSRGFSVLNLSAYGRIRVWFRVTDLRISSALFLLPRRPSLRLCWGFAPPQTPLFLSKPFLGRAVINSVGGELRPPRPPHLLGYLPFYSTHPTLP